MAKWKELIMKVGIITFHRALNYGAVLQAYALSQVISRMGIECEVIDYHNNKFENEYKRISITSCKNYRQVASYFLFGRVRNRKWQSFIDFIQDNITLSQKKYTPDNIHESNSDYDVFITGSDQVWNLFLTGNDWHYFLDFVENNKRKVSYAASITTSGYDDKICSNILASLKNYHTVSVREQSGKQFIDSLSLPFHTHLVVDPTLLMNKNEWLALANLYPVTKRIPERYLLAYFVSPNEEYYREMYRISELMSLPIVLINYTHRRVKGVINMLSVSPGEFVNLFSKATFVVTNSFHGTAFSINLQRNFLYMLNRHNPEKNERILTLVEQLNLENRNVELYPSDIGSEIDWPSVTEKLALLRDQSILILKAEIQ